MKYKWLQKNNNKKVIIFFNGWGMDENPVKHLDCEDYDVVIIYDYNNLNTDLVLKNYDEKYIISWSMGVVIAGINNNAINEIIKDYKSATAISATPFIIDDKFGIPEKIYNLTLKGFNETSALKFIDRMFTETFKFENFTNRSFESKKSELEKMTIYKSDFNINYKRAIIPEKDYIVPTRNQKRYWKKSENTEITTINSGHYPFLLYTKFSELI